MFSEGLGSHVNYFQRADMEVKRFLMSVLLRFVVQRKALTTRTVIRQPKEMTYTLMKAL